MPFRTACSFEERLQARGCLNHRHLRQWQVLVDEWVMAVGNGEHFYTLPSYYRAYNGACRLQ